MNTKGFRRMLFGEKMPDKNDPQYKERYERDVNAGRKFAQATRLDKLAAKIQGYPYFPLFGQRASTAARL